MDDERSLLFGDALERRRYRAHLRDWARAHPTKAKAMAIVVSDSDDDVHPPQMEQRQDNRLRRPAAPSHVATAARVPASASAAAAVAKVAYELQSELAGTSPDAVTPLTPSLPPPRTDAAAAAPVDLTGDGDRTPDGAEPDNSADEAAGTPVHSGRRCSAPVVPHGLVSALTAWNAR
jgi:hypothetical protein